MTPKTQATEEKMDQMDIIKSKHFCDWKDIKKVKMQPECKKNLQPIYLIKNLYLYKELLQLSNRITHNSI